MGKSRALCCLAWWKGEKESEEEKDAVVSNLSILWASARIGSLPLLISSGGGGGGGGCHR